MWRRLSRACLSINLVIFQLPPSLPASQNAAAVLRRSGHPQADQLLRASSFPRSNSLISLFIYLCHLFIEIVDFLGYNCANMKIVSGVIIRKLTFLRLTFLIPCLILPVVGPSTLRAQDNCPPSGTTGSVYSGIGSPNCAQVNVPAGRKFVVLYISESTSEWQYGYGCQNPSLGSCDPVTVSLSVTGPGVSYTAASVSGPATSLSPPGMQACVSDACNDCYSQMFASWWNCIVWEPINDPGGAIMQACVQQYTDAFNACMAVLPPDAQDWLLTSNSGFYEALVLPADMSQNGGTLTLQVSSVGDGTFASMSATLYGDIQVVMTQTPADFRPMDARDQASNCPAFDPANPTNDNCHITYQVELALPMMVCMAPDRAPLPLRVQNGPRLGQRFGSSPLSGLASIAPQPTRYVSRVAFAPGQALPDSAAPSRPFALATFNPSDGHFISRIAFTPRRPLSGVAMQQRATMAKRKPTPAPRDASSPPALTATYQFNLTLPTAAPGAPPVTWLPGTSTNYTPPGTDLNGPDPDYVIETAANDPSFMVAPDGLSVSTPPEDPSQATSLVVTSHDFGGVAELHATATIQGLGPAGSPQAVTVDVNVVGDLWSQNLVPAPADSPTRLCGSDFAQHPFASLPVDQDCNGIADSWEAPYIAQASANSQACGGPAITSFTGSEDIEPGYTCTSPQGDGYSVHDEYRGFHYIQDTVDTQDPLNPTGVVSWTSTDPVNTQDVFFWDSAVADPFLGDPCSSPQYSTLQPNCITTALRTLLAPAMVNAQGQQFMSFWRVNATEANAFSAADPSQGVNVFNQNSITMPMASPASRLGLGGFALVYGSDLSKLLGASDCAATSSLLGLYAAANAFANNGSSFINVALDQIAACGYIAQQSPGDGGYPQETFLATVIAHETSHRLGLFHLYRPITYQGPVPVPPDFQNLTMQGYMDDSNIPSQMYIRYGISNVISNTLTPPYQQLDRFAEPSEASDFLHPAYISCPAQSPFSPTEPVNSGDPWTLSGCNFDPIPHKLGPVPASPSCVARYATQAAPTPDEAIPSLPFFAVETSGITVGLGGLDIMGFQPMFNRLQFGTVYGFDPVCELPYLNATPAPQN